MNPEAPLSFRQALEAFNMGVVPADPYHLYNLTIGGLEAARSIRGLLASEGSLSRVYMGYYGAGKSHHLRLVESVALEEGWVVAGVEVDAKDSDPAKGSRFYKALVSGLAFPRSPDGHRNEGYLDLITEIRSKWPQVSKVRELRHCPWFGPGMEAICNVADPRKAPDFLGAVQWLFGQIPQHGAFNRLVQQHSAAGRVPILPTTYDTSVFHVHFLVVLSAVLRSLGYRGLAIVIDEAEHVRRFGGMRLLQARNLLELMLRTARTSVKGGFPRERHGHIDIPKFWRRGPQFALFVGLTPDAREENRDYGAWGRSVRSGYTRRKDALGFLTRPKGNVEELHPPSAGEYRQWVVQFLSMCGAHLGTRARLLADPRLRDRIAGVCEENYRKVPGSECVLRHWTRLAGFVPALLLRHDGAMEAERLVQAVAEAAQAGGAEETPWEGEELPQAKFDHESFAAEVFALFSALQEYRRDA